MEEMEERLDWEKMDGLIPAVVQDYNTREVLMLAYMNKESLKKTLETGLATYWSRERQELWVKGKESGNTQRVKKISIDCDYDAILLEVEPKGPACHHDEYSCFYREIKFIDCKNFKYL